MEAAVKALQSKTNIKPSNSKNNSSAPPKCNKSDGSRNKNEQPSSDPCCSKKVSGGKSNGNGVGNVSIEKKSTVSETVPPGSTSRCKSSSAELPSMPGQKKKPSDGSKTKTPLAKVLDEAMSSPDSDSNLDHMMDDDMLFVNDDDMSSPPSSPLPEAITAKTAKEALQSKRKVTCLGKEYDVNALKRFNKGIIDDETQTAAGSSQGETDSDVHRLKPPESDEESMVTQEVSGEIRSAPEPKKRTSIFGLRRSSDDEHLQQLDMTPIYTDSENESDNEKLKKGKAKQGPKLKKSGGKGDGLAGRKMIKETENDDGIDEEDGEKSKGKSQKDSKSKKSGKGGDQAGGKIKETAKGKEEKEDDESGVEDESEAVSVGFQMLRHPIKAQGLMLVKGRTTLLSEKSFFIETKALSDAKLAPNATTFARALLVGAFSDRALLECSLSGGEYRAGGRGNFTKKPPLDQDVVAVIIDVALHRQNNKQWNPKVTKRELNAALMQKLVDVRPKLKRLLLPATEHE